LDHSIGGPELREDVDAQITALAENNPAFEGITLFGSNRSETTYSTPPNGYVQYRIRFKQEDQELRARWVKRGARASVTYVVRLDASGTATVIWTSSEPCPFPVRACDASYL
jgi:hypothetical protein